MMTRCYLSCFYSCFFLEFHIYAMSIIVNQPFTSSEFFHPHSLFRGKTMSTSNQDLFCDTWIGFSWQIARYRLHPRQGYTIFVHFIPFLCERSINGRLLQTPEYVWSFDNTLLSQAIIGRIDWEIQMIMYVQSPELICIPLLSNNKRSIECSFQLESSDISFQRYSHCLILKNDAKPQFGFHTLYPGKTVH